MILVQMCMNPPRAKRLTRIVHGDVVMADRSLISHVVLIKIVMVVIIPGLRPGNV
jgi:hypothetical protein